MYKLTKKEILSLIKDESKKVLQPGTLVSCNFGSVDERTAAIYYVFALSTKPNKEIQEYVNLIQFFILTLHDCINARDTRGNRVAFQYAVRRLATSLTVEDQKRILNQTTPSMIAEFYSSINVLYDYVPILDSTAAIKVDKNLSLFELSKSLLDKNPAKPQSGFFGYNLNKVSDMLPDLNFGISAISDMIMDSNKTVTVESVVNGMSASDHYFSLLNENKPTLESCEFFCLVIKDWAKSKSQSEEMNEKLKQTLHFLKDEIKNNPQLTIYTEDLFVKHIPQLISHIESLKRMGNFESQIKMIDEYIQKINKSYVDHINFKLNVYNKYLKEKLADF